MKTTYIVGCVMPLYFIEKISHKKYKESYKATCLFCGKTIEFKTKEELYNSHIYNTNSIIKEQIKKEHKLDYSYEDVKAFIERLILTNPTLSNEMIINEFKLFLYSIDLASYMICKKRHNNVISNIYYQQKILEIEEKMDTLNKLKETYEKKKIKSNS